MLWLTNTNLQRSSSINKVGMEMMWPYVTLSILLPSKISQRNAFSISLRWASYTTNSSPGQPVGVAMMHSKVQQLKNMQHQKIWSIMHLPSHLNNVTQAVWSFNNLLQCKCSCLFWCPHPNPTSQGHREPFWTHGGHNGIKVFCLFQGDRLKVMYLKGKKLLLGHSLTPSWFLRMCLPMHKVFTPNIGSGDVGLGYEADRVAMSDDSTGQMSGDILTSHSSLDS